MADLRMNVVGEDKASAAMRSAGDSARGIGEDAAKSAAKWNVLAGLMKSAASAAVQFAKESVQAALGAEKADRRLLLAAKDLTVAFKAQASELSSLTGMSDETVKGIQAMLLEYGQAPAAVDATVKSILDYSAATGVDALTATHELIRGVDSGRGAFKELGLAYTATGDKTKDLSAATSALAGKFGGAASEDSMEASLRKAGAAVDEVKEGLGGFLLEVLRSSGLLELGVVALNNFAAGLRSVRDSLSPDDKSEAFQRGLAGRRKVMELASARLEEVRADASAGVDALEMAADNLKAAEKAYAEFATKGITGSATALPGVGGGDQRTAAACEADEADEADVADRAKASEDLEKLQARNIESFKAYQRDLDELALAAEERGESETDALLKQQQAAQQVYLKRDADEEEFYQRSTQRATEFFASQREREDAELAQAQEKRAQALKAEAQQWQQAAASIGAAFVNALTAELDKLLSGEEMDLGESIGNILASVLAVAGTVIGGIAGPGGAAIGGAVGGLAGMGIKAATRRPRTQPKTYHDGGWVGLPRFHYGGFMGGDERGAIVQTGERVLSRREVADMGGPAGVESAARGRGVTLVLNTLDAMSTRDFFTDRGGRGFERAVKSGRGDVARLLGAGVVY